MTRIPSSTTHSPTAHPYYSRTALPTEPAGPSSQQQRQSQLDQQLQHKGRQIKPGQARPDHIVITAAGSYNNNQNRNARYL